MPLPTTEVIGGLGIEGTNAQSKVIGAEKSESP